MTNRIQKDIKKWYANNSLIRNEFPHIEEDTSIELIHNMFEDLCNYFQQTNLNVNVEFFIHKRDFPLKKLNKTESYDAIYGVNYPLISHNYESYCPILCFSTTQEHADLCVPTWEDYSVASQAEGKFFADSCKKYSPLLGLEIKWESKINTAVFRGSTTGSGVTIETNPRLKLAYLSSLNKLDYDGLPLLNAKITKWNLRPRILNGELHTIEVDKYPLNLIYEKDCKKYFMTTKQQATYKYIINVDGHVQAFRLSFELSLGSVILYTDDSKYYTWFSKALQPWVHYVPIKSNMEDLFDKIQWCKENDNTCQQIAYNARAFYNNFINKQYMFEYLSTLLTSI